MKSILLLILFAFSLRAEQEWTRLKSDEEIVFYPSIAQRVKGKTNLWRAEIRGNVFEPEQRRLVVAAFRETIELRSDEMTSAEAEMFSKRARLFLVDHERGKKVFIRLGTNEFYVGKSGADGRFAGEIRFTDTRDTTFTAILGASDKREFKGRIFPMEAQGLSVISDIDDTIKITEVRDRKATLRNTFLREFRAVPGMAQFYLSATNEPNISFHYVSASPWQLYEPLAALVKSNGFPAGTFELKEFRWKGKSFLSLFSNPEKYKPGVIEPLLKQFPKRTFILIGDSGERDPEIYGALARKFPEQIFRICIRDVTNEPGDAPRYTKAFRDVPGEKWQIFREPTEIKCLCE
ncbi:MAG TPA: phosphatase domain-containing protein [Verrucomicrobiae bacterium]|nr:phosphatase domain-containing protein [Verrucomicrobiae bacterium]